MKDVLGLLLLGLGGYFIYENFFAAPAPAVTTLATTPGQPSVPVTPANTTLTVADAATLPYNSAITAAQMQAINSQIDQNIQSGQVPVIGGTSVLAFMLGWGGLPQGTTRTALGETYTFDGTNWQITPVGGMSGYRGLGYRAAGVNYIRRPMRRRGWAA